MKATGSRGMAGEKGAALDRLEEAYQHRPFGAASFAEFRFQLLLARM